MTKKVPAWFIEKDGVRIDGPYFLRTAALMRLASYPSAEVVRYEVDEVESSIMTGGVRRSKDTL